jgi:hypothetical protein
MHDGRNVAPSERWLSLGAGMLIGAAAAHLLYRAATGYCPIYAALGIASMPDGQTHNPNASVPYSTSPEDLHRFKSIVERGEICAS